MNTNIALEKIEEVLKSDFYAARDLAIELFKVDRSDVFAMHAKCNFKTYLQCFCLQISAKRYLYIMTSEKSGDKVLISRNTDEYNEFEYEARKAEFVTIY